jgi:glutathione S-transferase
MYKLYGRIGTGSTAIEALLSEANAPHRVEYVESGPDGRPPDYFYQINPMGQIPALTLPDGTIMTESAAIALHLADAFPQATLAPRPDSRDRPAYLRWMLYLAVNIYMTEIRIVYPARYTSDGQPGAEGVKRAAVNAMAKEWDIYAAALGNGPFMLGETMSAVDIYAAMLATWNSDVPQFFQRHPNIKAMYERVTARPSIAKVWAKNQMEGWTQSAA